MFDKSLLSVHLNNKKENDRFQKINCDRRNKSKTTSKLYLFFCCV